MMNGDLYDMERHAYEEIRRNSGAARHDNAGHDVTNTLRAVVVLVSICVALLGICTLTTIATEETPRITAAAPYKR